MNINLVLLIIAMLCFALAAGNVVYSRINFVGLGLFFWTFSVVLSAAGVK